MTRPTNVNISIFNTQAASANLSLLPTCPSALLNACTDAPILVHPLERDEPRYNIINEQGDVLWYQCSADDAQRLAAERCADADRFPGWQGPLVLSMFPPSPQRCTPDLMIPSMRAVYPPPFPAELQRDPAPALIYRGGQIGLGDDHPLVTVQCGTWFGDIRIEEALRNIDRFTEPCRARILACLPLHYDMGAAS